MLIGPEWAVNIELCDLINVDPGQVKDALKILKKRLGNKNPKIQLLALFVLEILSKNCGQNAFQQIVELDILHDIVKIVKKKAADVEFPPRVENSVPLFTPPQTHPVAHPAAAYVEAAVQASLQSDPSGLSLSEIQNAEGLADVLMEILVALDLNNPQGVKDEAIIDLVEQCLSYQKRVMILVNNTVDDDLLRKGLALNDNLQRVLIWHDDIAKGTPMVLLETRETPVMPLMNLNHEYDESEDDFAQLAHRSSRDTPQGQGPQPVVVKSELKPLGRVLPPPASRKPTGAHSGTVDFLSVDVFETVKSLGTSESITILDPSPTLSSLPINDFINPMASLFAPKTMNDEPASTSKSADQLPPAPLDVPSSATHPPTPTSYNQRQQFFEQEYSYASGPSHLSSGARESQNPSIKSSTATKQGKSNALFKEFVDFAKIKSSSPNINRKLESFY
ncbi:TOM1 2 [Olea europaea subsp. europaea]|uniref:TOM1 2 n=1 Tax=Olea europaea subsp. europaea TaxID=158383 RepID=A0A8S0PWI0_OLEEU|nr:TOM1 2 [Olea europaea subsp. europaea]